MSWTGEYIRRGDNRQRDITLQDMEIARDELLEYNTKYYNFSGKGTGLADELRERLQGVSEE